MEDVLIEILVLLVDMELEVDEVDTDELVLDMLVETDVLVLDVLIEVLTDVDVLEVDIEVE